MTGVTKVVIQDRSPVGTNFYVAEDSAGMEMPRAWTENAITRRISKRNASWVCPQSHRS